MNINQIDKVAIEYNKTKDPELKKKWYKLVKMFANENTNDTNTVIQWNSSKRKTRV